MFAAAVLGELHDTVKAVGTVFRVVGDTAGALTGGSIKAVGAVVNVRLLCWLKLDLVVVDGIMCSCFYLAVSRAPPSSWVSARDS